MGVLDQFRLDGRRVFISGGSRGLGREMALALAEAGADIVLTGRDPASLAATAADIRARGRAAFDIACDMSDATAAQAACERTLRDIGPVHTVVNNVGGRRESTALSEQRLEDWQRLFDFNLKSCFLCTRILGEAMLARSEGGRIINIASGLVRAQRSLASVMKMPGQIAFTVTPREAQSAAVARVNWRTAAFAAS